MHFQSVFRSGLLSAACATALTMAMPLCATAATYTVHKSATKPAAAAPISVPPIKYKTRVLANGMKVFYSRDTTTPNVTVQVWYGVGSKDDPNGRSGFAHLFEHLMFKATKDLPPETFDRLTEDVGGFNNASTWDDFTNYYEVVPTQSLERLIWAESERLGKLVVDDANFASERDVVKEELRQSVLSQPYGRLFSLYIPQNSYAVHPYKRPGIGSIEELDAATIDDVRAFHATYYRPDNANLIVVGNFDEAQLNGWIDKYMGVLKTPSTPIPHVTAVEPQRSGAKTVLTYGPNVPLPAVVITWLAPKASDPDAPALKVLDAILSSGKSSRLYNRLVYDKKAAAEVFSSADMQAQLGVLYVGAIMSDGKTLDEGEGLLNAQLAALRDSRVSKAELDSAKTELIASKVRDLESVDQRAFALGYALLTDGDAAKANSEVSDLSRVTAADVQRVARKYFASDRATTIRYLPESERPKDEVAAPATVAPVASVKFTGETYALSPEAEREAMPPIGKAVDPVLPAPAQIVLQNGLKVVVARSSDLPLVAARLIVKAGASSDPANKSGTASLLSDVITEGTMTRSAQQIAAQSEALGTEISAGSGREFSNLSLSVVKSKLKPALRILADVAEHPAFKTSEVDRVRTQSLDGLKLSYQQPRSLANFVASPVIFAGTPLGHVAAGTPASLARISRDDLVKLHDGAFRPDNALLVLTGDITPAEGFAMAKAVFGGWTKPEGEPLTAPVITPSAAPRDVVVDLPGTGQTAVIATKTTISRRSPDYYIGLVTNAVLGGGYSARLNEEIRIKRGLSYGASSALSPSLTTGSFIASAQTKNESAGQVVGLVKDEMNKLSAAPIPFDELTARKSGLVGGFGRTLGTANGLASILGDLSIYNIDLGEIQHYTAKVEAVTTDQISAFARTELDPAKASFIVVGDHVKMGDAITTALPAAEVIPLTSLDLESPTLKATK